MKYLLVDAMNLYHRCRHITRGDAHTKVGMSLHVILNSIQKSWTQFKADHVILTLEGKSWREEVFPAYKASRRVREKTTIKTPSEIEEDKLFLEAMGI